MVLYPFSHSQQKADDVAEGRCSQEEGRVSGIYQLAPPYIIYIQKCVFLGRAYV